MQVNNLLKVITCLHRRDLNLRPADTDTLTTRPPHLNLK